MKITLAWILSLLGGAASVHGGGGPDLSRRIDGDTAFALHLYQHVRAQDGNLFLSPQSVSLALAMTAAGAGGPTAAEMSEVLRFPAASELTHQESAALNERWRKIADAGTVEFAVANSLWPQTGAEFLPEYLALIERLYGARITPVDFLRDPAEACRTINAWVEDKTRNKIRDLLSPSVITPLTRLVLVNAIYFKGQWAKPFPPRTTRDDTFHPGRGPMVNVPFMNHAGPFGYFEDDRVQVLELPYAGEDLAMVIVLPKDRDGLGEVETRLTGKELAGWIKSLAPTEVRVALPKFSFTGEFRLDTALQAMGMRDAFDRVRADFSKMNGLKDDLYIGAVVHKAFVDVNEEGTEAAAATAVAVLSRTAAPPVPRVFRANHPFLFLIRDRVTGSVLFLGRIVNPAA